MRQSGPKQSSAVPSVGKGSLFVFEIRVGLFLYLLIGEEGQIVNTSKDQTKTLCFIGTNTF